MELSPSPIDWDVWWPQPIGNWTGRGRDPHGQIVFGRRRPEGGPIELVDPRRDERLPDLRHVLGRGHLVAYRPGRRAVIETGDGFLKVLRADRVAAALARHGNWRGQPRRIPRAVPTEWAGIISIERIAGAPLMSRCSQIDLVGPALAAFHAQVPLDRVSPHPDAALWARTVGRAEPAQLDRYLELAAAAGDPPSAPSACVHGDLHDKNVLVGRDIGFIDLDSAAAGAPEADLGNLAAHLDLRRVQRGLPIAEAAVQALLNSYPSPIDPDLVLAHRIATWFRLACIYRYRRGQAATVERLIAAIESARTRRGSAAR